MKSAIYTGKLHHRRTSPKIHDFTYDVALFYLDLSEAERLFKFPFIKFVDNDYLKGEGSLQQNVRKFIFEKTKRAHVGPIRILTQIRYFGFCFNPVSFYYCFDAEDRELEFILAEITNTPWGERKAYVFECKPGTRRHDYEFEKDFHVSPFMPMNLLFRWSFGVPMPESTEHYLMVHMEDWNLQKTEMCFEATLSLRPKPLTSRNLAFTILCYPLLTFKAFIAIYYQAFVIKLKNIPFYPHPSIGEKA